MNLLEIIFLLVRLFIFLYKFEFKVNFDPQGVDGPLKDNNTTYTNKLNE